MSEHSYHLAPLNAKFRSQDIVKRNLKAYRHRALIYLIVKESVEKYIFDLSLNLPYICWFHLLFSYTAQVLHIFLMCICLLFGWVFGGGGFSFCFVVFGERVWLLGFLVK